MSTAYAQIIANVAQVILLAIVAGIVKAWSDRAARNHEITQAKLKEVSAAVVETKSTVAVLEKNTNSIKDALVKVTGEKFFAEGIKQGTLEEKARANEPSGLPSASTT
jgi:hypothetical protein